jgi:hypothetical protein
MRLAGVWDIVETTAEGCIVGEREMVCVLRMCTQRACLLSTRRKGLLDMEDRRWRNVVRAPVGNTRVIMRWKEEECMRPYPESESPTQKVIHWW